MSDLVFLWVTVAWTFIIVVVALGISKIKDGW